MHHHTTHLDETCIVLANSTDRHRKLIHCNGNPEACAWSLCVTEAAEPGPLGLKRAERGRLNPQAWRPFALRDRYAGAACIRIMEDTSQLVLGLIACHVLPPGTALSQDETPYNTRCLHSTLYPATRHQCTTIFASSRETELERTSLAKTRTTLPSLSGSSAHMPSKLK